MKKYLVMILAVATIGSVLIYLSFKTEMPTPNTVDIYYGIQTFMENNSPKEAAILQALLINNIIEDIYIITQNRNKNLQILLYLILLAFIIIAILMYVYCERKILSPFRKLQKFAHHITAGNLDIQLTMDKNNVFGAFTESFDIMRDELRLAKENENKANKSKKELIASLAHDILFFFV